MKIPFVDLHTQYLNLKPEIDAAIADVIANTSFIRGPQVDKFEKDWADTVGIKHCISCANGTDAIYISMKALGIKPGDEVITTAHTWISTSETITQAGGRVIFCDTDKDTFNIDPKLIESKITDKTVGIIPVHLYGQACDMDPILEIAKKSGLWTIEDCAQAHLATYKGRQVGTMGDMATYSFYPGKNLGAYGDAGGIVTNNDELATYATTYARHGGKGEHVMEGMNSRMDGIQGAVLNVKRPHLQSWSEGRRKVAARYDELLAGVGDIITPKVADDREHVYHLYVIRTERRDELKKHLADNGIPSVLNYPRALPFFPAYSYLGHSPEDFPESYRNQSMILSIPIFPEISEEQIVYVAETIRQFYA
jgi:dTDP-4-amino-4,6-dideoxygalactose transaminase